MPEIDFSEIAGLVSRQYGVTLKGELEELNERDGQRVLKATLADRLSLIIRLCPATRSLRRVMSDTRALFFLGQKGFPVPQLRLTLTGERVWEWQPGCWAYVLDYIDGVQPEMDLPTLNRLAELLAQVHSVLKNPAEYPARVGWLDELPGSIAKAEKASADPRWGKLAQEVAACLKALPPFHDLPLGLCHTDVHEGNLLRTPDGQLYLLDWEDAGLGEVIFDIALVLGWNCVWPQESYSSVYPGEQQPDIYDFDEEYCCSFLTSYQRKRPLSKWEAAQLGNAIRFVMGWFAARDIAREIEEPGVSDGLAFTNWAIMRSVTTEYEGILETWVLETSS